MQLLACLTVAWGFTYLTSRSTIFAPVRVAILRRAITGDLDRPMPVRVAMALHAFWMWATGLIYCSACQGAWIGMLLGACGRWPLPTVTVHPAIDAAIATMGVLALVSPLVESPFDEEHRAAVDEFAAEFEPPDEGDDDEDDDDELERVIQ